MATEQKLDYTFIDKDGNGTPKQFPNDKEAADAGEQDPQVVRVQAVRNSKNVFLRGGK